MIKFGKKKEETITTTEALHMVKKLITCDVDECCMASMDKDDVIEQLEKSYPNLDNLYGLVIDTPNPNHWELKQNFQKSHHNFKKIHKKKYQI